MDTKKHRRCPEIAAYRSNFRDYIPVFLKAKKKANYSVKNRRYGTEAQCGSAKLSLGFS
jgi:hypothetical protein